jgi:hypothetical protein
MKPWQIKENRVDLLTIIPYQYPGKYVLDLLEDHGTLTTTSTEDSDR